MSILFIAPLWKRGNFIFDSEHKLCFTIQQRGLLYGISFT